jgi:hypothetical protein
MSRRKFNSVRAGKRHSRHPFKYLRDYDSSGYRHVRINLAYRNWIASSDYAPVT